MVLIIFFSWISFHLKQEREKSTAGWFIPYPLAELGVKSTEGWELGFLLPVLWPSHCRCSTQEARPLPTASQFLLRRKTQMLSTSLTGKTGPERSRGLGPSVGGGGGEASSGCYRKFWTKIQGPTTSLMKKAKGGLMKERLGILAHFLPEA